MISKISPSFAGLILAFALSITHTLVFADVVKDDAIQERRTLSNCPENGYSVVSHSVSCFVNFLCMKGKIPFKIAGCGCGCRGDPTFNSTLPLNATTQVNTSCPTGPNYGYVTHNSPCVISFLCVIGKEPFSIPGCGCGCRTINATQHAINVTEPANTTSTVNITSLSNTTCPTGSEYDYVTRKPFCLINFLCMLGKEPFSIPGCGCGCRNATKPVVNVTTPVNRTSTSNMTCPAGPDYGYVTRHSPCLINFLCILGKEPFSIPGCGCGCRNATKSPLNTTTSNNITAPLNVTSLNVTCPTGPDYVYVKRQSQCFINFLCMMGTQPFAIAGCGCGCHKTNSSSTVPTNVTSPCNETKPVSNITNSSCPIGSGVSYVTRNYPCIINFLCLANKQAFAVPDCGCGCKPL